MRSARQANELHDEIERLRGLLREVVAEDDEGGWGEFLLTSDLRARIDAELSGQESAQNGPTAVQPDAAP